MRTGILADVPQILRATVAVLIGLRQIMHDSLAFQIRRQRLTAASLLRLAG